MRVEKKQTLSKRQDNTSFVLNQASTTSPYSTPAFHFTPPSHLSSEDPDVRRCLDMHSLDSPFAPRDGA